MTTNPIDCPICGAEKSASHVLSSQRAQIDSISCEVAVHAHRCSVCECVFANESDTRSNKREMVSLKKRIFDLLPGPAVRAIRDKFDLTLEKADRLFGGGKVAFSKYEHNDLCQSTQMDILLRGAREVPEFYVWLCKRAGVKPVASSTDDQQLNGQISGRARLLDPDVSVLDYAYDPRQFRQHSLSDRKVSRGN